MSFFFQNQIETIKKQLSETIDESQIIALNSNLKMLKKGLKHSDEDVSEVANTICSSSEKSITVSVLFCLLYIWFFFVAC